MTRSVALVAMGFMLGVAGCGSSGMEGASGPTGSSWPAVPAAPARATARIVPVGMSRTRLQSELLTVSDLPMGWSSTQQLLSSSSFCGITAVTGGGASGTAEADFQDGQDPIFDEHLVAYPASPKKEFYTVRAIMDQCSVVDDDGTTLTARPWSFPKFGAASAAYQFVGSSKGLTLGLDLIVILKANLIFLSVYGGTGTPDTAQLATFVRKAIAKLSPSCHRILLVGHLVGRPAVSSVGSNAATSASQKCPLAGLRDL